MSKVQPKLQVIEDNQENPGMRLGCFGDEKKMAEQSAKHFTCFTVKYCLKSWQEQHEENLMDDICYLEYINFVDPNRLLSPKFPNKDALLM